MRSKKSIMNAIVGIISQIVVTLIEFIVRSIFIKSLGINMLGLNGVMINILSMLNLAELGLGTAIGYNLYKPLYNNDNKKIAELMKLYKRIYINIAWTLLIIGSILTIIVPSIAKESGLSNNFIRVVYITHLLGTVSTYLLSYKRTLFIADQKQYINTIVDTIVCVIFSIIKIVSILKFKSYLIYLLIHVIQNIFSNIILSILYNIEYKRIIKLEVDYNNCKKDVFRDLKNIIFGKVAGYIYSSTDNIIISIFLGVTKVGLLSNYILVISGVKRLVESLVNPVQASIGNMISEKEESDKAYKILELYTIIRYIIGAFCIVNIMNLIQPFIVIWIGKEFKLSMIIPMLLCLDLFIHILQGGVLQYINAVGLFKYEKYISIYGAIINLVLSLILVNSIGLSGVIIGTVISQLFFIIGRTIIIFKYYFKINPLRYVFMLIKFSAFMVVQVIVAIIISSFINNSGVINLLLRVIVNVSVVLIFNFFVFYKSDYYFYLKRIIKK